MKSPKPPDPEKTAAAQAQMNRETAITQYGLGATNQVTPYGNLTYDQIGEWEDGTPRFQATTSFSPEQQGLYDREMQAYTKFGDIANTQLDSVADRLSTPWDIDDAAGKEIANMQRQFLDPQWQGQEDRMAATLAARGLDPEGDAYKNSMRDFSTNRQRAYDQMYLDSQGRAIDIAQRERDQPLRELTSMLSMTQPQSPQFQNTPQPGVAPVDYTGLVQSNYQQQQAAHNAKMGGIFGMISAPLGGWAQSGFAWSDRRLKTDIDRLGVDPRGFGWHHFRYIWDEPGTMRTGVMADEVVRAIPEAVREVDGFLQVDYGAL